MKPSSFIRNLTCRNVFNDQPPEVRKIVGKLRMAIKRLVPDAEESCVWGCLSYHRPRVGGRVKGAVCQIVVRREQVRLDFIHGIRMRDPAGLLRGRQVSKRFVPIETLSDALRPEIAALVREAAAVGPAPDSTSSSGRKERV
jgi:hypothetical protein